MPKYTGWWGGVGEVCIDVIEAKNHKEARALLMSQIVIRRNPSEVKE